MASIHTVVQGEYLKLIAGKYGFADWHVIYDHSRNADFRKKRPNPNIIFAGDHIYIPDKNSRDVQCQTGKRSRFRLKATDTVLIRVVLKDQEKLQALPDLDCVLKVGDAVYQCKTDKSGLLERAVPATAETAELTVARPPLRWTLYIGHLDPLHQVTTDETIVTGVQARLNNLGYHCGAVDGILGPRTRRALKDFQRIVMGREKADGNPDPDTRAALEQKHEC